jgi:hypothetical protein
VHLGDFADGLGTGYVGNPNRAFAANLGKMWSWGPPVSCPCLAIVVAGFLPPEVALVLR